MTVTIHYKTHRGAQVLVKVANAEEASRKLEALWRARIKARAIDDESKAQIGDVWELDGRLVWGCFV